MAGATEKSAATNLNLPAAKQFEGNRRRQGLAKPLPLHTPAFHCPQTRSNRHHSRLSSPLEGLAKFHSVRYWLKRNPRQSLRGNRLPDVNESEARGSGFHH